MYLCQAGTAFSLGSTKASRRRGRDFLRLRQTDGGRQEEADQKRPQNCSRGPGDTGQDSHFLSPLTKVDLLVIALRVDPHDTRFKAQTLTSDTG